MRESTGRFSALANEYDEIMLQCYPDFVASHERLDQWFVFVLHASRLHTQHLFTVADFGIGTGYTSRTCVLSKYPKAIVHGYDQEEAMLITCERILDEAGFSGRYRHSLVDLSTPQQMEVSDIGICAFTLHNLAEADRVPFLMNAASALPPEAELVLLDKIIPDDHGEYLRRFAEYMGWVEAVRVSGHYGAFYDWLHHEAKDSLNPLTEAGLAQAAEQAGFELLVTSREGCGPLNMLARLRKKG
jgi:hypothetical protein